MAIWVGMTSTSFGGDNIAFGFCKAEFFTNLSGTAVSALKDSEKFLKNEPDQIRSMAGLQILKGFGENYGARLTGSITVAESGDYHFFIASKAASQFFLSTNESLPDPAILLPTCEETSCCNPFDEPPSPRTTQAPIHLEAGQAYGFTALLKAGTTGDSLQVAFRRSDDPTPAALLKPIGGKNLSTSTAETGASIAIQTQPQDQEIQEGRSAVFTVEASANSASGSPLALTYQWQRNGVDIPGATDRKYQTPPLNVDVSGSKYSVTVLSLGAQTQSTAAEAKVLPDLTPPQIVSVGAMKNLNANRVQIGIVFNESVLQANAENISNYSIPSGTVLSAKWVANSSGTDRLEQGVVLEAEGILPGNTYSLKVQNIADTHGNVLTESTPIDFSVSSFNWAQIGRTNIFPSAAFTTGAADFNLVSGGHAFWDVNDDITMVYEEVVGDFDKMAQIEFCDPSSTWARSGISARESLNGGLPTTGPSGDNPASRYQMVCSNPTTQYDGNQANNQFEAYQRLIPGGLTTSSSSAVEPEYPNTWVRLKRVGDHFSMFESRDGTHWANLDTTDFTPTDFDQNSPLGSKMFVGPTFGPENGNIPAVFLQSQWATRVRHYGDTFATPKTRGKQSYSIGLKLGANEQGSQLAATDVAGVDAVAQGHWNNLFGPSATGDSSVGGILAEQNGAATTTPVTVEFDSSGTWVSDGIQDRGDHNNLFTGADFNLMAGYLDTSDASTTYVSIQGLPSELTVGEGYDLVVYFLGGVANGRGGGYRVLDDQGNVLKNYVLGQSAQNPDTYAEVPLAPGSPKYGVGNYVVFRGLTNSQIRVEASTANGLGTPENGSKRAPLNGIQLVAPSGLLGEGYEPPIISIVHLETIRILFTGKLTVSDQVDGPFVPVVGAVSPYEVPVADGNKFFRTQR